MNIDELPITNVSYRKLKYIEYGFDIIFEINGFQHKLSALAKGDRIFYPNTVFHVDENSDCQYCEGGRRRCNGLTLHQEELFHRLIEFPSIRLEWLYINHV